MAASRNLQSYLLPCRAAGHLSISRFIVNRVFTASVVKTFLLLCISVSLTCQNAQGEAAAPAVAGRAGAGSVPAPPVEHGKINIRQGGSPGNSAESPSHHNEIAVAGGQTATHEKIRIGTQAGQAVQAAVPEHGKIHIGNKISVPEDDAWVASTFAQPQLPPVKEPLTVAQKQAASFKAKSMGYMQTLYGQASGLKETAQQTLSRLQDSAQLYKQQGQAYMAQGMTAVDNAKAMGQGYMAQGMTAVDNAKAMGQGYMAQGMAAVDNAKTQAASAAEGVTAAAAISAENMPGGEVVTGGEDAGDGP